MPDTILASTELRWLASHSTSCLHAAEALCRGLPLADSRLSAAITESAEGLYTEIRSAALPAARFWRHLIGLSPGIENNHQLAELALKKTVGTRPGIDDEIIRLASWIAELENAVQDLMPRLVDELALRAGPLREQWEARGPGLLKQVAQWTHPAVLAENADVVLVHPALGGGGAAHLPYNSVRIEAVLANPVHQLPEVVRLGWLISQLNLDLPALSENINADRLPLVAELAMLPVALKAAEHVELTHCNSTTIELAMKTWNVVTPPDIEPVDVLVQWWETYLATRPRWPIALAALDRMLS